MSNEQSEQVVLPWRLTKDECEQIAKRRYKIKRFTIRKAWPETWMFGVAWCKDPCDGTNAIMFHFGSMVLILGRHIERVKN